MISIRKFLDTPMPAKPPEPVESGHRQSLEAPPFSLVDAYRATLAEMGRASVDACPATGPDLERGVLQASEALSEAACQQALAACDENVRIQLQDWGRRTACHYRMKAAEVKDMLMAMAQTAESVGERDQRCARRLHAVTAQLQQIANLDDISVMRKSIEERATELKTSIDRMTEEGQAVLHQLQDRVASFQAKLEEAERAASLDALTRLRSRPYIEAELEQRIAASAPFCAAIFDIDRFKLVNDTYGHVVGDELLRQFSAELRSAFRSSDIAGRWGGDEFIVLLDCAISSARAQVDRVRAWVCGNYAVEGISGPLMLRVNASVGLAEFVPGETVKQLIARADAAMYREKTAARAATPRA